MYLENCGEILVQKNEKPFSDDFTVGYCMLPVFKN